MGGGFVEMKTDMKARSSAGRTVQGEREREEREDELMREDGR